MFTLNMEEEDGVASKRGSTMGNDTLALNFSQTAGADASNVDLVGRLKNLSSGRQKLMAKYFDLEDGESWPLLSEYFAVALAFVALGAMIREANVRMRKKDNESSDGVSPKLQRMALDSMLKSAMERLRGLAHRTQLLEEKLRDRSYMEAAFQFERLEFLKRISGLEATIAKNVEAEAAWRNEKDDLNKRVSDVDAQRAYFFKKMAEAEGSLGDLQRLRVEDGKANAKLVEIYAGREQSWKSERLRMRREIEVLKERVNKILSQTQMQPSQSFEAAAEALKLRTLKRRAKEIVREKVVSEEDLSTLAGVEQICKSGVDSRSIIESSVAADGRRDPEGADFHELTAAQNSEMDAELAIILKRVGAIKRRGSSGSKLDELLNEAKGKPKLKRLGSFDQAPKGMVVDDPSLCRLEGNNMRDIEMDKLDELLSEARGKQKLQHLGSLDQAPRGMIVDDTSLRRLEANNARGVEIDKEGSEDIWQAIEVQEGKYVQGTYGLDDEVTARRGPVRRSLLDSTEFIQDSSSLKTIISHPQSRTLEGSAVAEHDRVPQSVAVESAEENTRMTSESIVCNQAEEASALSLDEGCWGEPGEDRNGWELEYNSHGIACTSPTSDGDHCQASSGSKEHLIQLQTSAVENDYSQLDTNASPGSMNETPVVGPAHDSVGHSVVDSLEFSEDDTKNTINVSSLTPTSPTSDSGHSKDSHGEAASVSKECRTEIQPSTPEIDHMQADRSNEASSLGSTSSTDVYVAEVSADRSTEKVGELHGNPQELESMEEDRQMFSQVSAIKCAISRREGEAEANGNHWQC